MKNIFLIPTSQPSRLFKCRFKGHFIINPFNDLEGCFEEGFDPQNIYITSNEEIKEGDWCIDDKYKQPMKYFGEGSLLKSSKKIIITDNKDLIEDGVQEISEDFLQWFVKNQSCEFVEVSYEPKNFLDTKQGWEYEIIIPETDILDIGQIAEKEENTVFISNETATRIFGAKKMKNKQKCKDCNNKLTDCTCIEDTIDLKQEPGKETADYIDSYVVQQLVKEAKQEKERGITITHVSKQEPFKHECRILSKEEVLANRSNAYEFIDFDKQETMEYDLLQHIKFCLECGNEAQAIRLIEKYGFQMQEQDKRFYSEEEVLDILRNFYTTFDLYKNPQTNTIPLWFEQNKNK